mmetsp:Transcript_4651/g.11272  ORF Transcript_4651/g.11272 Transcript_4651/m.11272 type:complete len:400 (-) Transcript_4651:38-1237(-)
MAPKEARVGAATVGVVATASAKLRKGKGRSSTGRQLAKDASTGRQPAKDASAGRQLPKEASSATAGTLSENSVSAIDSPRSVASAKGKARPRLKAAIAAYRMSATLAAKRRAAAAEVVEVPPEYTGPRPDEELLAAVHKEVTMDRRHLPAFAAREEEQGCIEDVYWKLRHGHDANQRQVHGFTPLAVAAAAGNVPLMTLLMDRDADVSLPSIHRNETAVHHACRYGRLPATTMLLKTAEKSCGMDAPNAAGWTPLHIAVDNGNLDMMRVLLESGASPEEKNQTFGGDKPIHMAVRRQDMRAVEMLLEHSAQVDVANAAGMTPLHIAAASSDYPCVSLLVRSRGDAGRRDSSGRNALQCVPKGKASSDKVILLLQAYARPPHPGLRSDARFERDVAYRTF